VDSQIALALIASLTSLAVAVGGIPLNYLIGRRLRRERDLDAMSHYRDPLLQATADLRSRLVTILAEDFLGRFFIRGKEEQKSTRLDTPCLSLQSSYAGSKFCGKQ
jgi:hypothetical protein